jgi:hypothetical protein
MASLDIEKAYDMVWSNICILRSCVFHLCWQLIKLIEEPAVKSPLSNGDIATNGDTSAQSQDEDDTEWKVR